MKNLINFFGSLLAILVAVYLLHRWLAETNDPGFVLLGIGHWSLETSFTVFVAGLMIGFCLFYWFFRLLGIIIRMPRQMAKRKHSIKFNRSQEALIAGLFDAADGNWEKAENILIKHAANSGAPLLHYLTAARAAQSRGALDKRDEYLKKAAEQSSDTNMTLGLTQAELHLSEQQFEQALETLSKLHSIDPGHARVLKMMHQTYQHIGDWEGLSRLLPSLEKHKVLMETEVKILETRIFSSLLKQAAQKDQQAVESCWEQIPQHIKILPGVANIYFAAMISAGAGLSVESAIAGQLARHWDNTLLMLYAGLDIPDVGKHLQDAEKWLAVFPNDAVLLAVLGRLALKDQQTEKAEQYLQKSLRIDPSVDACQFLGDVMLVKGEKDEACQYYKRALELASGEVLNRAESIGA
ncbi:MAG: heme biosynthesis HemY N-terminal domain-containing protein [Methylococcales bacterium]|nr:heme biosynthesis HemY N-terminal domain-containing protein [Methylococcales bacterium]